MTHRRPIGDPSETDMPDRGSIGDRHAWSETNQRPTCLIGDPSEIDLPHRRPTCLIGALSETHWRPTTLIGDPLDTDMSHWRPIGDRHASSKADIPDRKPTLGKICISYVGLRSEMLVSDGSLIMHMGLKLGMSVSNGSPIRHVGLQLVFDRSPMGLW